MIEDVGAVEGASALVVGDRAGMWTRGQLDEFGHAFARWLRDQGVDRDDRVVLRLPSVREMAGMIYGSSLASVTFVPLNETMKPFQLRAVLADAAPSLVVVADGQATAVRALTGVPVRELGEVCDEMDALLGTRVETAPRPGDVLTLIYTSGSTAAPKAVVCPRERVEFVTAAIGDVLGYRADDVIFCRSPLSFDYGLYQLFLAWRVGAEIVLADGASDLRLLSLIASSGATVVPLVPSLASMLVTLAARTPGAAPGVRMFTNTGAALPQATIDALRHAFPAAKVVRMYGITECKRVTIMPPDEDTGRPGSCGRALPGTRVRIMADGAEVPPGAVGEIVVSGPHVMDGYWRSPELTARTYRRGPDGEIRLHTGDYGRLDAEGHLYFEGRRDDLFKRKGVRTSTTEIEAAATDIPGVLAAVALPPAADRDLTLCVIGDLEPHEVLRAMAERLEPAKVPARCHVLAEFPLTANGKSARSQLSALVGGTTT